MQASSRKFTLYVDRPGVPADALMKMAKLGVVIDGWMRETDVNITAVQCWTAMEEFFGVVPCTVMSMMSNSLMSSACEVDIFGTIAMHALALASRTPSALLDWNNNYGDDPDKAVCFHCSNLPKHFFEKARRWTTRQSSPARSAGRTPTAPRRPREGRPDELRPLLHRRRHGHNPRLRRRRRIHRRPAQHLRRRRRREIPDLQNLLRYICENGFEHHVAANLRTRPPRCMRRRRATWAGTSPGTAARREPPDAMAALRDAG